MPASGVNSAYNRITALFHNTTGVSSLITIVVLSLASLAGIVSRLFSVIRFESSIAGYDPWFNYRATAYMVQHGFYNFFNWFDERAWYPLGRHVGATVYPGLMITSGAIHWVLYALNIPVHIRDVCVFVTPVFSGLTAIASYLLTSELWSRGAGLYAACFIAIIPGYSSRSVAGCYENEGIAIFALQFTFYLWLKSVKTGSVFWSVCTALSYFYMVSAWGGYVFIINLIPLHVFVLLIMGRFSQRLFVSYSVFYIVGLLCSMQIPFVGFQAIRSSEHMAASGVFALLMVVGALKYLYTLIPKEQFKQLLIVGGLAAAAIVFSAALLLPYEAVIAPWSGRIYALWDANHGKTIPLVASVNEHKPTTWTRHFCDLHVLVCAFPVGLWYCIKHINDERVFVALYAISAAYFAGVMVRLMLTLTPVVCVLAGIAFSILLDLIVPRPMRRDEIPVQLIEDNDDFKNVYDKEEPQSGCLHSPFQHDPGLGMIARWSTLIALMVLMSLFSKHCTWITNNNYSHSSNVYESWAGKHTILDDYREAYGWLSRNTPDNATIMSWWDYGYLIAGLGNRTSVIDNNTWNNTHIALVGKAMASNESVAYEVMTALSVDYVLITFGGFVGFSSDCVAKFLWPVRIAQGEFPKDIRNFFGFGGAPPRAASLSSRISMDGRQVQDIKEDTRERDYLTASGSYQIGSGGTKAVFNSLLFKLAYYKYNSGGDPPALDRVRGTTPGTIGFKLTYLEEAYTTENWLIRIYRVKKPHEFNRPRLARFERKILLRRPVSKKTLKSRQGQLKAQPTVVKGKIATRLQ